jgi:hypothetical protein
LKYYSNICKQQMRALIFSKEQCRKHIEKQESK